MIFEFEGAEVDLDRYQLRRGGEVVPVEPQVFDVLVMLLQERRRVSGTQLHKCKESDDSHHC